MDDSERESGIKRFWRKRYLLFSLAPFPYLVSPGKYYYKTILYNWPRFMFSHKLVIEAPPLSISRKEVIIYSPFNCNYYFQLNYFLTFPKSSEACFPRFNSPISLYHLSVWMMTSFLDRPRIWWIKSFLGKLYFQTFQRNLQN